MNLFPLLLALTFIVSNTAQPIIHADLDGSFLDGIIFDEVTTETFGGTTSYDIGWVKVMFCAEAHNDISVGAFQWIGDFSALAPYAISIKIVPDESDGLTVAEFDDLAVYGKVCQNSIIALNNELEMSNEIDVTTLASTGVEDVATNWYGATSAATARMGQTCSSSLTDITTDFYHACGNTAGLHVQADGDCEYDFENPRSGKTIAVWLGFDATKRDVCTDAGDGSVLPLNCNDWDCDDGNPCTDDTCDDSTGAPVCSSVLSPEGTACDDGDLCTSGDICMYGECSGAILICDNGNACDGLETCNALTGECDTGTTIVCDDNNECTTDTCDPSSGSCVFLPSDDIACDDGDLCTSGDMCMYSECIGDTVICDDGNECTTDTCDPISGSCVFLPSTDDIACDDGDLCTSGDICISGECIGDTTVICDNGNACDGLETCNALTGECETGSAIVCDDNNPCTIDTCNTSDGTCSYTLITSCSVSDDSTDGDTDRDNDSDDSGDSAVFRWNKKSNDNFETEDTMKEQLLVNLDPNILYIIVVMCLLTNTVLVWMYRCYSDQAKQDMVSFEHTNHMEV